MPATTVGDRWLVSFRGRLHDQDVVNTFMYGISTMTGVVTLDQAATAIHAQLVGTAKLVEKFCACCPNGYTMVEIWYQVVAPGRFGKQIRRPTAAVGTAGVSYTPNNAAVILRRGDLATRKNVSTLHVPLAVTEDNVENGYLSQTMLDLLQLLANEMKGSLNTTGSVMNLIPVINNGPNIADFSPITTVAVEPTARVMRRRTVGLGV